VKLITWNIQWGRGIDGVVDLPRIIAHARGMADFDVLCLQEVADNLPDLAGSDGGNQFTELARLLPGYSIIDGVAADIPGDGGRRRRFGNVIATRLPVGRITRHILPWPADTTRSMTRGLIEAVVQAPSGPVRVLTTHLEYFSLGVRRAQVEAVRGIVADGIARANTNSEPGQGPYVPQATPVATVLVGDFNMKPEDPEKTRMGEPLDASGARLVDAWLALHGAMPHPHSSCIVDQSFEPAHCCDFVFVTADLVPRLGALHYDVDTRVSDHQPVLATLG
jgi:endonuclease/exonuclease/phosphatase family metal-dependent hydrolase